MVFSFEELNPIFEKLVVLLEQLVLEGEFGTQRKFSVVLEFEIGLSEVVFLNFQTLDFEHEVFDLFHIWCYSMKLLRLLAFEEDDLLLVLANLRMERFESGLVLLLHLVFFSFEMEELIGLVGNGFQKIVDEILRTMVRRETRLFGQSQRLRHGENIVHIEVGFFLTHKFRSIQEIFPFAKIGTVSRHTEQDS